MIERHTIPPGMRLHPLRAQDLTASDIAAAAGVDPHKTALKLYAEKTGLLMAGPDNKLMRRGRWLEPAVIEALHDEHPDWRIIRPQVYMRDSDLRLGATPDALAESEEGITFNVQCKVVSRPAYERDWSDGPPLPYVLQTLTEGLLLDLPSIIAALVIDTYSAELYLHPVPRHAGAENRVKQIATDFWANVASGQRPAADYTRDAETVVALFPTSVAEPVLDLSADNMLPGLLADRVHLRGLITGFEKRIGEIDTEIKDKLGEHERAELPGWKISWKTHERKEYTVPAATYRTLRVTEVEEKEEAA